VGSETDTVGDRTVEVLEETHGVTETDNVTGVMEVGDNSCFIMNQNYKNAQSLAILGNMYQVPDLLLPPLGIRIRPR
jgi:hypothetical protein